MRFAFVAKHRSIWPVAWLCKALDVSRSGFHAWLNRSPSKRTLEDEAVLAVMRRSFTASDRTYGARRIWHDVLAEGFNTGLHRIERLMRENAMRARPRRRYLPRDCQEFCARGHSDGKENHLWQSTRNCWTSYWLDVIPKTCFRKMACWTT